MENIKKNLEEIYQNIDDVTSVNQVMLVAVSKQQSIGKILQAINCGQKNFG